MASSRLLTKILADFLFGFYLLNYMLNHATNHIQTRWQQFGQLIAKKQQFGILNFLNQNYNLNFESLNSIKNKWKKR